MSKIIQFNKSNSLTKAVDLLMSLEKRELITDLILVYSYKDGDVDRISNYWFGTDSTLKCLGLVTYMIDKINKYINGEE